MKQRIPILMAMLMSAACVLAGNIKDVWLAMPNSVAPYLNSKLS